MSDIIALIDGSIYSQSVCDHVAWIAGETNSSVELIHVLGSRQGAKDTQNLSGSIGLGARSKLLEELAALDSQKAKLAQKYGRAILEEAAQCIEDKGVSDVSTRLRIGDLVETLQDSEAEAQLVVVGKRGESADFAKGHLGSNLERIVRSSSRPVLVASRAFQPIKRVLFAFDGGASSMKAVDLMAAHPAFKGLAIKILRVGKDTEEAQRDLGGAATALRENGCEVEVQIRDGQPDTIITEEAESGNFDLLAMGAYGHSRIRNLIIGSTTTVMIRSCKIPVLLFR